MTFRSLRDVDTWLHEPGKSIELLREALTDGRFSGRNGVWARAWLERHEQFGLEQKEEAALQRELRMVTAAEDSAAAAKSTATWGGWSLATALAALALSAWPYIKEWLQ